MKTSRKARVIEVIVKAMKTHIGNVDVFEIGCRAILDIARDDSK